MKTNFALALVNPELPCPSNLCTRNGSDATQRFAVYRNNVTASLIDVLAETFPVVLALVGTDFFRAMARVFVQTQLSHQRVLAFYGRDFAQFVDSFKPAAGVAYLADEARLEMARIFAYHAADATPMNDQALRLALAGLDRLERVQLQLHPSVHVVASPFAIVSIWAAHQQERLVPLLDADEAQTALIFRADLNVLTLPITASTGAFIAALQRGSTLPDALHAATEIDCGFDPTDTLTLLIQNRLFTAATETVCEQQHHGHPQ